MAKKTSAEIDDQDRQFIEAARALGYDESPAAFKDAVKKVARHTPSAPREHPAKAVEKQKDS